jgi:hypothetical protein
MQPLDRTTAQPGTPHNQAHRTTAQFSTTTTPADEGRVRTMQISDSVRYVDGGAGAETAAQDHPVGEVTLGASGALGLRSRMLGTGGVGASATMDTPFTTATVPL